MMEGWWVGVGEGVGVVVITVVLSVAYLFLQVKALRGESDADTWGVGWSEGGEVLFQLQ